MKRKIWVVGIALCMGIFSANAQTQNTDPKSFGERYEDQSDAATYEDDNTSSSVEDLDSDQSMDQSDDASSLEDDATIESDDATSLDQPDPNNDGSYSYESSTTTMSTTDDESTLGTIVKAPFRIVGYTAKEVGEGVGHIAGAPFKGAAKLVKGVGEGAAELGKGVAHVGKGVGKGAFSVVSETGEGLGHIVRAPFRGIAKAFNRKDKTETVIINESTSLNSTDAELNNDAEADDASARMDENLEY